jgi:hypothetical protein
MNDAMVYEHQIRDCMKYRALPPSLTHSPCQYLVLHLVHEQGIYRERVAKDNINNVVILLN